MIAERPKAFIPTEDQGYLICVVQTPDGTSGEPTAAVIQRVEADRRGAATASSDVADPRRPNVITVDQPDQLRRRLRHRSRTGTSGRRRSCGPPAWRGSSRRRLSEQIRDAMVMVLQPPPIQGLSQTGGFELMIEDREGKGVEALQRVVDRFQDEARKRPELAGVFTTFSARVPQLRFDIDRTKARRLDVPVSDVFAVLQTNLGGYYVNDFNLYGKVWKVMVQAEGGDRAPSPRTSPEPLRPEPQGGAGPAQLPGRGPATRSGRSTCPTTTSTPPPRSTASPPRATARARRSPRCRRSPPRSCPRGSATSGPARPSRSRRPATRRPTSSPSRSSASSCSWRPSTRAGSGPLVIILTVPLAMFGAMVGLWLYDMPLDVFGQIGLVMLIGLETKNAILIVEFGVELMREARDEHHRVGQGGVARSGSGRS